jgi:superoxide dismutase, Fe-Mn family
MWEHAFYLQYLNVKPKVSLTCLLLAEQTITRPIQYLEAIWNVINFEEAEARYKNGLHSGTDAGVTLSKI